MLRKVILPILALTAALLYASTMTWTVKLDPSNEPLVPTNSDATGVAHFQINPETFEFKGFINVQRLSAPLTGYHIHRGAPGVAGPILVNLPEYDVSVKTNGTLTRITYSGVLRDRAVGGVTLSKEQILEEILTGDTYINVHTTAWPAGEVRGELGVSATP